MPHVFESGPIEVERFYTGVISQRNRLAIPIRILGRRIIELYDAILSGNDLEITVRSTLQRRAGYIQYNTNPVTGIPQKFYPFQQTPPAGGTAQIYVITDTTAGIYSVPPQGTGPVQIATKTQGLQSSFYGLGTYLYIGNQEFLRKWDGGTPQGLTNWGISLSGVAVALLAYAGTGADGGGVNPWANPTNIQGGPDGNNATVSLSAPINGASQSNPLNATNYGFVLTPGSTVNGVQATITGFATTTGVLQIIAQLMVNGNPVGTGKLVNLPTTNGSITIGSPSDLWGATLNPAVVDGTGFGIQLTAKLLGRTGPATATVNLDAAALNIFFSGGPTATPIGGAGAFSATQGYQYLFVYGNSNDNNISNPTPASISTGPFASSPGVQVGLVASTDPQVNQIRVFRTTDTGTGAIFFELPTSPYSNVTGPVTDSAPDNTLVVSSAITVGTLVFSPPPSGLQLMEWYAGRIWGAVGNLLYFSAGPDNSPMGNGNSNWPPGNVFALPTTIVKLVPLSGGNGMLVVTLDKIHIVQGITNPGFTVNVWSMDIGARQQNAVDSDGSTIYMFTSDRQFLQISANGTTELSQYISDATDNLDPTLVYVACHRSGSQDSRVFLSDGSATIFPYNLMSTAWEPQQIPVDGGGVGAIASIEIQAGVYKFLKGATTTNKIILQRDLNTFSDNGNFYAPAVIFGNIPVADPTQLANIADLVLRYSTAGGPPLPFILPNEIGGNFVDLGTPVDEPPEASSPPSSYRAKKYSLLGGFNLWTQMTHFQLQILWGKEAFQNELFSWGVFPNQASDQQVAQLPQVQGR